MPRRIVDISVALKAGIVSDPPYMLPQITYVDHKAGAENFHQVFGVPIDQLPDGAGPAVDARDRVAARSRCALPAGRQARSRSERCAARGAARHRSGMAAHHAGRGRGAERGLRGVGRPVGRHLGADRVRRRRLCDRPRPSSGRCTAGACAAPADVQGSVSMSEPNAMRMKRANSLGL